MQSDIIKIQRDENMRTIENSIPVFSGKHNNKVLPGVLNSTKITVLASVFTRSYSHLARFFTSPDHRRPTLAIIFAICTIIYYSGELLHTAGLTALQWQFFYGPHDIHRMFFFAPIIYACNFFGLRATIITAGASLLVFIPRAIFISPYPDSLARTFLFIAVAVTVCSFIRTVRRRHPVTGSNHTGDSDRYPSPPDTENGIDDGLVLDRNLEVNLTKRSIKHNGQVIKLTPIEHRLLEYLVRNNGKVVSHEELVRNVWGEQYGRETEYLHTFIWQIRKKIKDDPANPKFIITERGVGYSFVELGKLHPALNMHRNSQNQEILRKF